VGKWILTEISSDEQYRCKLPESIENAVQISVSVRIHLPTPTIGYSRPLVIFQAKGTYF